MPDDYNPDHAQPGTQEYAAAAHLGIEKWIARMKAQLFNDGADDLLSILWSVGYDNREGLCVGIDGEPNALIETMAVAILKMADGVQAQLWNKEQFLPEGQRTRYAQIVSNIETQLMLALKHMTQDKINAEKESHIIVPRTDDGLIHSPNSNLLDVPESLEAQAAKAAKLALKKEKKLG